MARLLLVGATALLLAAPAAAFPRFPAGCARSDFASGGATVRAELCRPAAAAAAVPGVVVLHGCGGFDTFDHRLSLELPRAGIATLAVDYFGPTPPPGRRGFCGAHGAVGAAFPTWVQETADALDHLRRQPDVGRVGLVGWSLGGGVAVSTAASFPRAAAALVGFSTGFFGRIPRGSIPRGLPPTLLLSGGARDAIPLAATRDLYDALRTAGVRAELYDYGHGVHDWPGRQGTVGIARAASFLRRILS